MFALFLISFIGQALTRWSADAGELRLHELSAVGFLDYLTTGHFISATFENRDSEFLQTAAYIVLTVFLFQKGSPESKKPDEPNPEDEPPHQRRGEPDAPGPVRLGGLLLKLYSHSLSPAPVTLFLLSFWLHLPAARGGRTRKLSRITGR